MENHDDEIVEIRQGDFDRLNKTIVDLSEKFGFLHGFLQGLKYLTTEDAVVKAVEAALERVSKSQPPQE